jgi:hypothetical protein
VVRDTRGVKASGLQGDALPEMIEIIDDDTDPFGDRASTTAIEDTSGPRWVGPAPAAAAPSRIIGFGVVIGVVNWNPKVSRSAASHRLRRMAPAVYADDDDRSPVVLYYSADPPREFTVQYAEFVDPSATCSADGNTKLPPTRQVPAVRVLDPQPLTAAIALRSRRAPRSPATSHGDPHTSTATVCVLRQQNRVDHPDRLRLERPSICAVAQSVIPTTRRQPGRSVAIEDTSRSRPCSLGWPGAALELIYYPSNTNPDSGIGSRWSAVANEPGRCHA